MSILCARHMLGARHNARCWEMREFCESRMMPRFLTWQRDWIKMPSIKWGNLGKQFPEAALVKRKCRGDFSAAKS